MLFFLLVVGLVVSTYIGGYDLDYLTCFAPAVSRRRKLPSYDLHLINAIGRVYLIAIKDGLVVEISVCASYSLVGVLPALGTFFLTLTSRSSIGLPSQGPLSRKGVLRLLNFHDLRYRRLDSKANRSVIKNIIVLIEAHPHMPVNDLINLINE
jgi:hypothetical protein